MRTKRSSAQKVQKVMANTSSRVGGASTFKSLAICHTKYPKTAKYVAILSTCAATRSSTRLIWSALFLLMPFHFLASRLLPNAVATTARPWLYPPFAQFKNSSIALASMRAVVTSQSYRNQVVAYFPRLPSIHAPVAEGFVSASVESIARHASVLFAVGAQVVGFVFHGRSVCRLFSGRKPEIFQIQGGCQ